VEALAFQEAAGTSGSLFFCHFSFGVDRMRALILITGAALTLAACGNNDQRDNTANVDENLTAENIVSNDVTAIDAVTGDASNMAADVNYMNAEDNSVSPLTSNSTAPKPKSKPKAVAPAPATTPPAGNTVANTTG
jgi:hypothetical protein